MRVFEHLARPDAVVEALGAPRLLVALRSFLRAVRLFAATNQLPGSTARASAVHVFRILIWLLFVRFIVRCLAVFYGTA